MSVRVHVRVRVCTSLMDFSHVCIFRRNTQDTNNSESKRVERRGAGVVTRQEDVLNSPSRPFIAGIMRGGGVIMVMQVVRKDA